MHTMPRTASRRSKFDHDRIMRLPLDRLRPASVNAEVYRPVDPADPDVRALADSIAERGLQEPIVVTLDNVILNGHRRHTACRLAGLKVVPCRRLNIRSCDDEFLTRLVEYNRQRVKSVDERLREEVVLADPEESYRVLTEHRRQRSQIDADTITIIGTKRRADISAAKDLFLDAIRLVLDDRRDYWPLSDRQIHYALLNDPPLIHASKPDSHYVNDLKSYKALIDLLTRARLAGFIPIDAIHDPTRPVTTWDVHREHGGFIRAQLDEFLKGYYRDLMQSQPNHVEIVGEKNTVESVIRRVAMEYAIPYTIGRGYCSLSPRYDMTRRFRKSGKERLVLLVMSDFDPEGQDIPHSFARSLRDDFGIHNIEPIKVALTHDQVDRLRLPPQMKAKASSSRYHRFASEHGDDVYELEAVAPDQLQELLRDAIDSVIDVDAFNTEIEAEKRDATHLDAVRRTVHDMLKGIDFGH
jgi:hypothetical protein